MKRHLKRWTPSEEQRLLRQVRAYPQNLARCFLIVSEELDRTPGAVAQRWYEKVSKQPEALCFFTASPRSVSRNRKNGEGTESTRTIWKKLLRVLRNII